MLRNSVRAVFVGVLFTDPVCWLEVFLQATETGPNFEKKFTNRQDLKKNSKCSSSDGFGPTYTTMTKLFEGWPRDPDEVVGRFLRDSLWNLQPFELLFFSLSNLLTARDGSVVLLSLCQVVCILFSLEQCQVVD